jgi:hypothetical protein
MYVGNSPPWAGKKEEGRKRYQGRKRCQGGEIFLPAFRLIHPSFILSFHPFLYSTQPCCLYSILPFFSCLAIFFLFFLSMLRRKRWQGRKGYQGREKEYQGRVPREYQARVSRKEEISRKEEMSRK